MVAAATSVVSFGIGGLAKLIPNIYLRAGFQAVAHGLYNGISTELQGGKFIHGFASGSISSISGSLTGGLKMGVVGKVAIGGVTGGVVSAVVGGDFYRGFLQGAIITAFNHALHSNGESAATSTTETESVENESGPGDPPQIGDICFDECGQAQVYDGKGWVPWRFTVTGTGQITPTDSPIDWVLGAWKTPFQAADDVAVLGFAKIAGGGGNGLSKILVKGTDDIIDLSKFSNVRGGDLVFKKFTIQKTIGTPHGNDAIYKLYNNGSRIATLDSKGRILRP